jgi:ubiquinone/menaquinone biosynthesis C-methylase UbiE
MAAADRPASLEGRWDILYRDYPEVYDAFARIPKYPDPLEVINEHFHFEGQVIADVGSGTGLSTFMLAGWAAQVIGIEPEEAMRAVAEREARALGLGNIRLERGDAEHLPLADGMADAAVGITQANGDPRRVCAEMERVVRAGGLVLHCDVAPGWYGGEFEPIITGRPRDESLNPLWPGDILPALGYDYFDIFSDQDYGTVEHMVRTYGFIHSQRVIDHIRQRGITAVRWKFRVYWKTVSRPPS